MKRSDDELARFDDPRTKLTVEQERVLDGMACGLTRDDPDLERLLRTFGAQRRRIAALVIAIATTMATLVATALVLVA